MILENSIASENISEFEARFSKAEPIQDIIKISEAITDEKYIVDVLNLIVLVASAITHIKMCSLWLIDKKEKPWRICLKISQGISADLIQHPSLALNQGVVGMVAATQRPFIIADVLREHKFKEKNMARKLGIVSMLSVPIVCKKGNLSGVLNCFTTQAHTFSETEVTLMNGVANQAAIAIFNTELMVRAGLAKEELDTQYLLIHARNVLMGQRKIAAPEASNWIHHCSKTSCRTLRQVAQAILLVTP
ncbi:MAG: GAF and ANTAR domain-containing protein [Proteobacteria bacterium]|nr:GAF and ANTAR domain-containing protein [Desulfobacula sp.]MBU3952814.1 GAF and ANTAR domain-containing protein [Pseudomonadota bacterium]MBU4131983.1 GAF and ANTAR domain-containing protein [Pseudomonadota bacterium]